MSEGDDIRIQLVRMEGTLNLANERLGNVQTDITDIRRTQNSHGDRLGILEADRNRREGEHTGKIRTSEIVWRALSFIGGSGGVFALMQVLK